MRSSLPNANCYFTEFNTETPAGAGYSDSLGRLFYGLPVFQEFQRRFQVWPVLARPGVLHALTDSFKQWRGNSSEPPRIAILDWREVPTFAEFVLFYDYFKAMGVETRIVDPRDVEYRDGKLLAGEFHITLIYKRVFTDELIDRGGLEHPVVQAVRDRAVCMVNSFRGKVLGKKASVAVLSDERNAALFTPEQQQAIAEHIPWTRVVEDRRTHGRWRRDRTRAVRDGEQGSARTAAERLTRGRGHDRRLDGGATSVGSGGREGTRGTVRGAGRRSACRRNRSRPSRTANSRCRTGSSKRVRSWPSARSCTAA